MITLMQSESEVAAQVSLGATAIQQSDCSMDFNF